MLKMSEFKARRVCSFPIMEKLLVRCITGVIKTQANWLSTR